MTTLVMQHTQGEWGEVCQLVQSLDKSGYYLQLYHSLLENVLETQRSEYHSLASSSQHLELNFRYNIAIRPVLRMN